MEILTVMKSFTRCMHSSVIRSSIHHTRRAVMYVPTADERKLNKIPSLDVDTIVLDFEDGVALNQKEMARSNVHKGLSLISSGNRNTERVVRINGLEVDMLSPDMQAIFNGPSNVKLDSIMLPKCDTTEHLAQLDIAVGFYGAGLSSPLSLIALIESPLAVETLASLCDYCVNNLINLKLKALVFGADDYLSVIGAQSARHMMYARQTIVTVAKAFGLQAIDYVTTDFKDTKLLEEECIEAARLGFNGKQVIHPGQVKIVQNAFTPSKTQVQWAKGLIQEFKKQQELGKGAFEYEGKMIDRPLLLQALNIIKVIDQ